jgi:hypothetical protein
MSNLDPQHPILVSTGVSEAEPMLFMMVERVPFLESRIREGSREAGSEFVGPTEDVGTPRDDMRSKNRRVTRFDFAQRDEDLVQCKVTVVIPSTFLKTKSRRSEIPHKGGTQELDISARFICEIASSSRQSLLLGTRALLLSLRARFSGRSSAL